MSTQNEEYLRSLLQAPRADQAFKDELRRRFIAFNASADPGAQAAPGAAGEEQASRPRGLLFRLGVLAAAAAAAIFVTFYLPEEAHWMVSGDEALDGLLVDGHSIGLGGLAELSASLGRGAELQTGERALSLDLSLGARMQVQPNSTVRFDPLPDAGSPEELGFELEYGEIYLRTGADYPGNPIRIETEDVEVMVLGTALGVLVDDQGTCTCVEHGEVSVARAKAPSMKPEAVGTGSQYFVFRNGEPLRMSFEQRGDAAHELHLSSLEDFAVSE